MPGEAVSRDKIAVAGALTVAVVTGLWLTYALGDQIMMDDGMGMQMTVLPRAALLFLMWWSMMIAMMLPSAAPAILAYNAIARKLAPPHPVMFVLGYLAIWTAFAGGATAVQIWVGEGVKLTEMMAVASRSVGAALLILAGLYQITALKRTCLTRCQTPFFYLAHHWRNGPGGAFRMGLSHGTFCLGCCWALMLLLFYGGVMDFRWIIGLALYVAVEKLVPIRFHLHSVAAALLVIWGAAVLALAWLPIH